MPPKVKFTREQIEDSAFQLVREQGMKSLSARSLAEKLGVSTAPIFTAFNNIEELQGCVKKRAEERYLEYFKAGMEQPAPFKGTGLKYIEFAKDEPELFKLLFMDYDMKDTVPGYHPGNHESSETVLDGLCRRYGLERERAKNLFNHLSVYTHGLAVMFAQGKSMFTMDDVSRMLTEIFYALIGKGGSV